MARTVIPLSTFTTLADLNDAGTSIDQSNGMYIAATDLVPAAGGIDRLVLYVTNTDSATHTVIIRAGVNPPAFEQGKGDLTTGNLTGTTGTAFITGLEPARFTQSDGSLWVDFSSGAAGKVYAILNPRTY